MKIKVGKESLLNGIQIVQNVVSGKITLPILTNILLETRKDKLKLVATDLDVGISCEIPVEILEEGGITIPAKRLVDIIREMPLGSIVIHAKKNNQIDIEGENCRFKLIGLARDEFPKFPEFKEKDIFQIEQKIFKDMLRLTAFSVSHEESQYVLNGVFLEVTDDSIKIVATDGRRLAKIEKKIINVNKVEASVIIPLKAVQEILRNLKEEGFVSFVSGANQVLFDIDGVVIATRIIEGEFPNYSQVIPPPSENKVGMDTQAFLSSIRRANLLTTQDFQAVKLEIFKDKIVVSKTTPDVGESREEIPIQYGGQEMVVGFNPHLLIDFLKNINEQRVNIELSGSDKPAVMRMGDYLYLALPMRI